MWAKKSCSPVEVFIVIFISFPEKEMAFAVSGKVIGIVVVLPSPSAERESAESASNWIALVPCETPKESIEYTVEK